MKGDNTTTACSGIIPTSLYRHPAWIAWKEAQGWYKTGELDGQPILCRDLNSRTSMAYVVGTPQAEEMNDDFGGRLERESLRTLPFLPANCMFLRWDLMASPFDDSQEEWLNTWLLELRMNASTAKRKFRKASVETLSMDTMIVNLRDGWPSVYSRMEHRVRYSERLARRRGTQITRTGAAGLSDFYSLYRKTAKLHGIHLHPESVFYELFASATENRLNLDLYIASTREKPAAAAIIARNDEEAWYLFASSDPELRSAAGSTALLCQALRDCTDEGIECIDLLGVAPAGMRDHPLSGLSLFKSGFGGKRKSRAGAWDFVITPEAYAEYARLEALSTRRS